MSHAPLLLFID